MGPLEHARGSGQGSSINNFFHTCLPIHRGFEEIRDEQLCENLEVVAFPMHCIG